MNFVEPIKDKGTIEEIGKYLKSVNMKYYVMYQLGLYSGLRVSDILRLRVSDVKGKREIRIYEKKTGKAKYFPIKPKLQKLIDSYTADMQPGSWLIPSARAAGKAVSREYAWKMIHEAGIACGVPHLGTHTMRKSFGYHFYIQTHDVVTLQKIFNHSSPQITLRYIGIEQSDIMAAMRKFEYK